MQQTNANWNAYKMYNYRGGGTEIMLIHVGIGGWEGGGL